MPVLTSDKYHIKWTQLADFPVPLWRAYAVAVQHHKIYVTGDTPLNAEQHIYVYNVVTDQWGQLPSSGHYHGVPHIIGGKLTIIGGRLSATNKRTNKVSTFDEDSQTWKSYYPDLLSIRSGPGVASHLEHIIVAGGTSGIRIHKSELRYIIRNDIEVLNWIENSCWKMVPIKLPEPMFGFTPTISDDHLLILGFDNTLSLRCNGAYKIPIVDITASNKQQRKNIIGWTELTPPTHWFAAPVPNSSPPIVVGGQDTTNTVTADIKMYDNLNKSWKTIGTLSSARCYATVATVYNNAIVVIGGHTKAGSKANAKSSSLTLVELGQVELLHHTIIEF